MLDMQLKIPCYEWYHQNGIVGGSILLKTVVPEGAVCLEDQERESKKRI